MCVYVVQVAAGQEVRAANLIAGVAKGAVEECFIPKREVMCRKEGRWCRKLEKLFPGYVFVRTCNLDETLEALRAAPIFTRLLASSGDTCVPLTEEEVSWINAAVTTDTHVVEMSTGVIEGDRVFVTNGPLKGQEARITHIDRHRRFAWMDMDMFGRQREIRIGLEIVSKNQVPGRDI